MTPLHYAVISVSVQIVRKLLLSGADKNVKDSDDLTPFDHAVKKNYETIA